ncbi:hypothetical protein GPALN_003744 [Globodera pallida]|nr:hypothetical protein GPALN_003744 [Globodera pallida]
MERRTRMQLSKLGVDELVVIRDGLEAKVREVNRQLLALLEERDALSMRRDALAVEVRDMEEWQRRMSRHEEFEQ